MLKTIIPVLVLAGTIFLAKYLLGSGPEAKKKPFFERSPVVETMVLKPQNYTVTIKASGIVKAGTQTNLVSEVAGRIVSISDDFKAGNYFNKNKTLITIDKANYENSLAVVKGDVAASRATLNQLNAEEKSLKRSYQLARKNLTLGKKEVNRLRGLWAKRLITRSALDIEEQKTNQLQQKLEDLQGKLDTFKSRRQATDAKIAATLAREKQERLNLSRTIIKAPYEGRVLEKNVDVGQFVGTGTLLGKVYATDYVEVDLPLSLARYELLNLPEAFKNKSIDTKSFPKVTFKNPNSNQKNEWQGRVVRSSAALDANSRQITVIARVDNPFDAKKGVTSPLRIGQYIEAQIKGKTFENVYVLPTIAVRQNKEILLLDDGKIRIVSVNALWNTQTETIVRVEENIMDKQLVTTSLSQATKGMKVITLEEQKKKDKKENKRKEERKTKSDTNNKKEKSSQ